MPRAGIADEATSAELYVTPQFIAKYWSFVPGSVAFINGCGFNGAGAEASALRAALHGAGATYVVGWTDVVDGGQAADSGLFLFDRMLGLNRYANYPASPGNRPFALGDVLTDMAATRRYNIITVGNAAPVTLVDSNWQGLAAAKLTIDTTTGANPPNAVYLAPSISGLTLDNAASRLTLLGVFGPIASAPHTLTINGQPIAPSSWTDNEIVINNLPSTGPGSAGPVVVNVDGGSSNPAMINTWHGLSVTNVNPLGRALTHNA